MRKLILVLLAAGLGASFGCSTTDPQKLLSEALAAQALPTDVQTQIDTLTRQAQLAQLLGIDLSTLQAAMANAPNTKTVAGQVK